MNFRFSALLMLWASGASAQQVPTQSLPAFDVLCYRISIMNFLEDMPGPMIAGKADDYPRFNLYTVNGLMLKVVTNPEEPGLRSEYGKSAPEISISPIKDAAKRPPVYTWKDSNRELTYFSYEAREKILSTVTLRKPNHMFTPPHTNEVLKCRDR